VIVVVVLGFFFVAILAILAAIAIPAYQDYTLRAKVTEAVVQADGLKVAVAEFFDEQQRCPQNGDAGFEAPEAYATSFVAAAKVTSLKDGSCAIRFTLRGAPQLEGKYLQFALDSDSHWHASTDLPQKYLPMRLRNAN
jgi:type IV pilus assembly protein PilA